MCADHSTDKAMTTRWYRLCSLKAGTGWCSLLTLTSVQELPSLYTALPEPPVLLGLGTNLVGSDKTEQKSVLRLAANGDFEQIRPVGKGCFEIGCAWPLSRLLTRMAEQGWGGLSALAGIPGTLGGALAMNAGAMGRQISQFVNHIRGWDWSTGQEWQWEKSTGGWGYRQSPLPATVLALYATVQFQQAEPHTERELLQAEWLRRRSVTPGGASAGSVFCNPEHAPPAGVLLEQAGCKGLSAGVFAVSQQHANWIVNCSRQPGRAEDCMALVEEMRTRVQKMFAIDLRCEWRWVD
jgi:UDP-N-acetylmuramate dehydrogenase